MSDKAKISEMSYMDLNAEAHHYRRVNLEGGEGYNPYQAEIERREADDAPAPAPAKRSKKLSQSDWYH